MAKRRKKTNTPKSKQILAMTKASMGNEWWKLRSKHGKDKLFASPKLLLEAAEEYFVYCDTHPDYEVKPMVYKGGIKMVKVPKKQPYTLMGLCLYLGCATSYFRTFKNEQKDKPDSKDYLSVVAHIEQAIYKQQYDGAASGFFNANIIARALGLAEKVEADVTDNRKQVADLFPGELNDTK